MTQTAVFQTLLKKIVFVGAGSSRPNPGRQDAAPTRFARLTRRQGDCARRAKGERVRRDEHIHRRWQVANPYWRFGLVSLGAAVVLTVALSFLIDPLLAWLVTINLVTVITYRYDKAIAGSEKTRVPERVLLLLGAVGGMVGAVIAMWFMRPRHKTQSGDFLVWFYAILAIQVVGIVAILFLKFYY
jgi:uncharacterized membrane protein YsdA (DUF1294 family)